MNDNDRKAIEKALLRNIATLFVIKLSIQFAVRAAQKSLAK